MKSITKIEDAYNLPEKSIFSFKKELQPDGTTINIPHFRAIMAVELEDNTIFAFPDKDGTWMQIEYDTEGAYKTPV